MADESTVKGEKINEEVEREENSDSIIELLNETFPADFEYKMEKFNEKLEHYRVLGSVTSVKLAALLNSDEKTEQIQIEIEEKQEEMRTILRSLDELIDFGKSVNDRFDKLLKLVEVNVRDDPKSAVVVEHSLEIKEADVVNIDYDDDCSTPRITQSPKSVLVIDSEASEDTRSVVTINID